MRLFIFTLYFFMSSQVAIGFSLSEGFSNMRLLASVLAGTSYHRQVFGSEYAHEPTQVMVREIQQEMGLSSSTKIHVMYMNAEAESRWGAKNLVATSNTIFIGRTWFNSLPVKEQRFLLAHELSHIQNSDDAKFAGAATVFCAGLAYQFYNCVTTFSGQALGTFAGLSGAGLLLLPAYKRYLEHRADVESIKTVDGVEGGIAYHKKGLAESPKTKEKSGIIQFFNDMFESHPSTERRLEALEALQEKTVALHM